MKNESIIIQMSDGRLVKIVCADIRGDKVRLAIEAPGDIPVHRQEVWDAIQRENRRTTKP